MRATSQNRTIEGRRNGHVPAESLPSLKSVGVDLVIRPAGQADRETAHRLLTAQLVEHRLPADPAGVAGGIDCALARDSPAWLWLAERDSKPVAILLANPIASVERGGLALWEIYAASAHRPSPALRLRGGRPAAGVLDHLVGADRQPPGQLRHRVPLHLPGSGSGLRARRSRTGGRAVRRGHDRRRTAGRAARRSDRPAGHDAGGASPRRQRRGGAGLRPRSRPARCAGLPLGRRGRGLPPGDERGGGRRGAARRSAAGIRPGVLGGEPRPLGGIVLGRPGRGAQHPRALPRRRGHFDRGRRDHPPPRPGDAAAGPQARAGDPRPGEGLFRRPVSLLPAPALRRADGLHPVATRAAPGHGGARPGSRRVRLSDGAELRRSGARATDLVAALVPLRCGPASGALDAALRRGIRRQCHRWQSRGLWDRDYPLDRRRGDRLPRGLDDGGEPRPARAAGPLSGRVLHVRGPRLHPFAARSRRGLAAARWPLSVAPLPGRGAGGVRRPPDHGRAAPQAPRGDAPVLRRAAASPGAGGQIGDDAMRRTVLALGLFAAAGCAASRPAAPPSSPPEPAVMCRCTPGKPCWPSQAEWQRFGATLHGKLEQPRSPLAPCRSDAAGKDCAAALENSKNPFYLQDQPGGTQSVGWLGAWNAAPSVYAVVAEDAADIVAAVNFARDRRLRLVIKGTGHDYLGRSSAPDSLLVWTHKMRGVSTDDAFVPQGCPAAQAGTPAVTVEAGTRWLEAYQEVTLKHGRYFQGGGCTTVGAAGGFMQGGGFGSWSKKFGIAAASMLEAEVVTADGRVLVANGCQNQDLFWTLRGGGGGTFGVVTRVTLKTHPLPNWFGALDGSIVAKDDAAFKQLLERFLLFYREDLSNEHWGEQVRVRRNDTLELSMVFQGMTAKEAQQVWQPMRDWVDRSGGAYTMKLQAFEIPGDRMWDDAYFNEHFPGAILMDPRTDQPGHPRTDQPGRRFFWTGDGEQVSMYWAAYQSRWVPLQLFDSAHASAFAAALFEASRHWSVALHFNKGQAGASGEAVKSGRETSMNPAVLRAAALIIVAAGAPGFPGVAGHEPDLTKGDLAKAGVADAMKVIRDATPGAGSYVNETDYFEPDWQQAFWGENYQRLSEIKQKYDPDGLFFCHHCVGSERWSN